MPWKQERDLLIAQTLAFAQSVTGKAAEADGWPEPVPPDSAAETASPLEAYPLARSLARYPGLREEIRGRVAAFRAHQEVLRRNRDEYYNSVLEKVRASTERLRMGPNNPPDEH
jgi:hypothetical protein